MDEGHHGAWKLKRGLPMTMRKLFQDRADAGRQLAAHLRKYGDASPLVVGLPRGGVPVAYEVARELDAPLDVCVVRKIGAPAQPELGLGAVSEGGVLYVDRDTVAAFDVPEGELAALASSKLTEADECARRFRRDSPPLDVSGKTVLVIDDGVATGGTARAALQSLRARGAGRLVLAVPVGAAGTLAKLARVADEVVCPHAEEFFYAVGSWYEDFRATTDDEVVALLKRARAQRGRLRPGPNESGRVRVQAERDVQIPCEGGYIEGHLMTPPRARGLVIFAHGSGSGRHSPRNRYVASELRRDGFATLLPDLLTRKEQEFDAATGGLRFDVDLLASRLVAATDWARGQSEAKALPVGYFGASAGAAAALVAAAARPKLVRAVVSRGGRLDLAEGSLGDVRAPTLLLVGGDDAEVLQLNREALYFLGGEKQLEVVPGATHLFEEPGALEQVTRSASRWFARHLGLNVLKATA